MVNFLTLAPVFLSAVATFAMPSGHNGPHHHAVRHNAGNLTVAHEKRGQFHGDGTWFMPNQGSCGNWNTPGDFIVALNAPQYAGGSHCGDSVYVCVEGEPDNCAGATVADLCPECAFGSLDMTTGMFKSLKPLSAGRIRITWNWGGAPEKPKPKPKPKPEPKATPKPKPTTHTHATPTDTPTTTKEHHHSSSSQPDPTSTSDSASSSPTPENKSGNIDTLTNDLFEMGSLLVVAGDNSS